MQESKKLKEALSPVMIQIARAQRTLHGRCLPIEPRPSSLQFQVAAVETVVIILQFQLRRFFEEREASNPIKIARCHDLLAG